ncbi:MAG: F0F1 ATP synthase subunit alpha [candidate division WOR-3 bacterium]
MRPSDLATVLRNEIERYQAKLEVTETGTVTQVGDGVARIYGLRGAMLSEMIEFPNDVKGMVLNLEEDTVGVVLLGDDRKVEEGDQVRSTGRILSTPVGEGLLGRVVNPLGQPLDDQGEIRVSKYLPIEARAPGVVARQPVREPVQTGIKAIDAMIPIGRGQRELILSDRGLGKTAVILDTIINQRGQDLYCIYCAIGQKASTVARVVKDLSDHNALDYSIVVSATASDPAALQYIAPYAACAMGEYFRDSGRHAIVFYDDLTKQAWAYRELALLLRRPPGREAYPGDVFYLHSRLLERAAKLSDEHGGGSLTAIPVIETQAGDIASYIPANVISITDGQIYLEPGLFYAGFRPAINAGLSVSRVGGNAQTRAMRKVAGRLRIDLAQYRALESFAQFGAELDKASQAQITRGTRVMEILKQGRFEPMALADQVIVINAAVEGFLDDLPLEQVAQFEKSLLEHMARARPEIGAKIAATKDLDDATHAALNAATREFRASWRKDTSSEVTGG